MPCQWTRTSQKAAGTITTMAHRCLEPESTQLTPQWITFPSTSTEEVFYPHRSRRATLNWRETIHLVLSSLWTSQEQLSEVCITMPATPSVDYYVNILSRYQFH